jgi:hypothetical protein
MSTFDNQAAPFLAAEEQERGDNLARFIVNVVGEPGNAIHNSLPLYQAAARNAFENAAKRTVQPEGGVQ